MTSKNKKYEEILSLLFSVWIYCLAIIFFGFFVKYFINFDIQSIYSQAISYTVFESTSYFQPKPKEKLIYIVGIFTLPILVPFFYRILIRNGALFFNAKVYRFICWFVLLLIVFLVIYVINSYDHVLSTYEYYLEKSSFNIYMLFLYSIISVTAIYLLIIRQNKTSEILNSRLFFGINKLLTLLLVFILISFFTLSVFNISEVSIASSFLLHFNAIYYSVVQVVNADAVLYKDNFINTYGMYPYLLEPIFRLVGGINVLKFSLVMSSLVFISYFLIYRVMRGIIKNNFFAVIGLLSIFWYQFLSSKPGLSIEKVSYDYYFQYAPLRVLFVSFIIFIAYKYLVSNNKIYEIIGSTICGLSVIWNHDSSFIIVISWILFVSYVAINKATGLKKKILAVVTKILVFFFIFATVFGLFYLYLDFFYGGTPSIFSMFNILGIYSYMGFGSVLTPIIHPWIVILLIYIYGFSHSLLRINSIKVSNIEPFVFLVSLIGLGSLSYYLSRSINLNLLHVIIPAILLLSLYADIIYEKIKNNTSMLHERIIITIIVYFLSSSIVSIGYSFPAYFKGIVFDRGQVINSDMGTPIEDNIAFMKKYINKGDKVLILSGNQGVYHSETETSSIINTGVYEIFSMESADQLVDLVLNREIKIFLDKKTYPNYKDGIYRPVLFDEKIVRIVRSNYNVIGENGDIIFFSK